MPHPSFSEKMGDWIRHILSCCDRGGDEEARKALQISGPTNFRREDITIPGLDPEQQRFIREKAISDARKLYSALQPLPCTPSKPSLMPSYEAFTTPRPSLSPNAPGSLGGGGSSGGPGGSRIVDGWRRHSRRLSGSIAKPLELGFGGGGTGGLVGGPGGAREDSRIEMAGLMEPEGKGKGAESFSGSEGEVGGRL